MENVQTDSLALTKSMDWFLYDIGLRHEKVKKEKSSYLHTR